MKLGVSRLPGEWHSRYLNDATYTLTDISEKTYTLKRGKGVNALPGGCVSWVLIHLDTQETYREVEGPRDLKSKHIITLLN